MTFDELIDAILCEQDSVTHYNEEGADVPMRLHQKYRQEAVGSLRDWVKTQVAAEREALLEAFSPIYDLMYVKEGVDWNCRICGGYNYTKDTVAHSMTCPMGKAQAAIRARAGEG